MEWIYLINAILETPHFIVSCLILYVLYDAEFGVLEFKRLSKRRFRRFKRKFFKKKL